MDRTNDGEKIACTPCDLSELPPTLPEPEYDQVAGYSSTIDPSHIIHLIRQLLPIKTAAPKVGGDLLEDPLSNRQDSSELESKCRAVSGEIVKEDAAVGEKAETLTRKATDPGTEGLVNDLRASHHKESDVKNLPETDNGAQDLSGSDDFEEKDGGVANLETRDGAAQKSAVSGPIELEEIREEAGCVLWDLAANETQAEFLVDNRILDVLLAILCLPQSDRMREICLGILGNLACHTKPEMIMVNFEGLVPTVIQQLQFEDPPSLCETCRLLSAGLHSDAAGAWINALQKEEVLKRIMWIADNTMNSQLREKSTELLLAIVDSKQEAFSALLPTLLRMGLPELLTDLIEGEVTAITEGTSTCGDAVLDIVLQIAEALSLADEFATQLASNQKLFSLACQVIRLSHKDEVGPSGITGTVLIANLLTEKNSLILEFLQGGNMITHLIGLLPQVTEDSGARNALWSILQRVCQHLQASQSELPSDEQTSLMAAFAEGSNLLMDDLDDHRDEDEHEDEERASGVAPSCGRQAKLTTIANIAHILEGWLASDSQTENRGAEAVRAAQNACQLLGNYSISPDSVMHDQVLGR
ncbi:uncharacterized protein [Physcomitrium patens]|uniref:Uncharacterized protein n=1 Tax=Physcomitrium patens TaxID=3218 RepID=A0A2K1KPY3_PHYPA|nr:uncharacterized protein LOC112281785 [Physcomitrium patens]PNR55806.1 hypothetical protein PHYPA_006703 [Physcomitrium patens]|eukprot:XP_024374434.1 uncharacterized protein LOC112281785 [Physcomitrella patens]